MFTRSDLLDAIVEIAAALAADGGVGCASADVSAPASPRSPRNVPSGPIKPVAPPADIRPAAVLKPRRVFMSDWELRRLRKPGAKFIRVPAGAIISPLARDWLDYEGIEVIFD